MNEYQNLLNELREMLDMKPDSTEWQILQEISDLIESEKNYREGQCGCCGPSY